MKVVILCVCSVAIGFVAGRNRPITVPTGFPLELKSASASRQAVKQSVRKNNLADFAARFQEIQSGPARHSNFRLSRLALSIPLEQAAAALEAARASMTSLEFYTFREQILSRWAEADPAAVIAYAESLGPKQGRDDALRAGLAEWAYLSPTDAVQYIEALPKNSRRDFFQIILPGVASTDPDRALGLLSNISLTDRFSAKTQILHAIAETSPAAAIEFFERHKTAAGFGNDERLLEGVIQQWIEKDSTAAMAWLSTQSAAFQKRRSSEVARACQSIAEKDPRAAAQMISTLPKTQDVKHSFGSVINQWSQQSPDECKAWLDQQNDSEFKSVGIAGYAAHLSESNPTAAVELLAKTPNLEPGQGYVQMVFSSLAEKDPQSGLDYCDKFQDSKMRSIAVAGVLAGWSRTSPREAAEYSLLLADDDEIAWNIDETISRFLLQDPAAGLEWIQKLPEDTSARDGALQRVVHELSNSSLELSAQYAQLLPSGSGAFNNIGQNWARANPEEAIPLAASLSDDTARASTLAGALGVLAQSSPQQAMNYVQNLIGRELEEATRTVVQTMSYDDPATTARWVATFPENLFRESLPQFLNSWVSTDSARARAWIRALPAGPNRDLANNYLPEYQTLAETTPSQTLAQ